MSQINLYNPYHDELGRFSSKTGASSVVGGQATIKKKPTGRERTAVEKKVFEPVAEFLTRKGLRYSLMRMGIDVGVDRVLYMLAGSAAIKGAAVLGTSIGAAAIGGSLAPVLLAAGFGVAAAITWMYLSEKATDKAFYGFLNYYKPDDKRHKTVGVTAASKASRGFATWWTLISLPADIFHGLRGAAQATSLADNIPTGVIMATSGDMVTHRATEQDILESIRDARNAQVQLSDSYNDLVPTDVQPSTGHEPGADRAKVISMLPYVRNVNENLAAYFVVPVRDETSGLEKMGFRKENVRIGDGPEIPLYVLDKVGARQFLRMSDSDTIPILGTFMWQSNDIEEQVMKYAV